MSWNEERVERLLGERARLRGLEPLPDGAPERLLAAVRAERARARLRRGAGWITGLAALVAAVLLVFERPAASFGTVGLEVALLNTSGRELDATLRGAPEDFRPPSELLIEVVSGADGFLALAVFGPAGERGAVETGLALAAGEALTLRRGLEGVAALERGDSTASWLLVGSSEEIPASSLETLLPPRIAAAQGAGRRTELEALAGRLRAGLGATVELREAVVARRAP